MAAGRPLSSCKVPNCQEKFQGFSGTHIGFFFFLCFFLFLMFHPAKTTGKTTNTIREANLVCSITIVALS